MWLSDVEISWLGFSGSFINKIISFTNKENLIPPLLFLYCCVCPFSSVGSCGSVERKTQKHFKNKLSIAAAGNLSLSELKSLSFAQGIFMFLHIYNESNLFPYAQNYLNKASEIQCQVQIFNSSRATVFQVTWTKFCVGFVSLGNTDKIHISPTKGIC